MADETLIEHDAKYPCSLVIHVPFPDEILADTAVQALSADPELSTLVKRAFSVVKSTETGEKGSQDDNNASGAFLRTVYQATTNRMLRVAVNGFFDSLSTIIQVMDELSVDTLHEESKESLAGVQGLVPAKTKS